MTLTMYSASVPVFVKMLSNSRGWLDKASAHAAAKGFDVSVLLNARLAPDMFPLTNQFQMAADQAKGCTARLAGLEVPSFPDTEQTVAELQARIEKTLAFIRDVPAHLIEGSEDREIVLKSVRGERRFKGEDYLKHHVTPNLYFHLTTAYAILRHNGVDVGKRDFLQGAGT